MKSIRNFALLSIGLIAGLLLPGVSSSQVAVPPVGSILIITSGGCPNGYTEVSALNGKTILGTVAANNDIGSTGGSDTITPAGTVSAPTLTMDAITSVINHTHVISITDPGHNHTQNAHSHTEQLQGSTTAST